MSEESELRHRKPEIQSNELNTNTNSIKDINKTQVESRKVQNVVDEEDLTPTQKKVLAVLRAIVIILSIACVIIVVYYFLAPLFVSGSDKLNFLHSRLMEQFCDSEGCTPEQYDRVREILRNVSKLNDLPDPKY